MKSKELFRLNIGLQSLAIFRNLLKDPVIAALREFLEDLETGETARSVSRYAGFVSAFYAAGTPAFSRYVERIVGDDENPCIRLIGRGETPLPRDGPVCSRGAGNPPGGGQSDPRPAAARAGLGRVSAGVSHGAGGCGCLLPAAL